MQWLPSLFGPPNTRLRSSVCRQSDFETAWYKAWTSKIAAGAPWTNVECWQTEGEASDLP
jgi:hypothetical protein